MEALFEFYLVMAAMLFSIGVIGVMWKRNAISVFMNVELMLNAANVAFVAFAMQYGLMQAGVLVLFVMTIAAAEAGVGLAIFIALFRSRRHIRVEELDLLHG